MEEFESKDVIDLVEAALAEGGPDSFQPEHTIPMGLFQGDMLERLYSKLDDVLDNATKQMLFDDLRNELYSGMEMPPLKELHTTSLSCRRCKEAVKPEPSLPKWNLSDPDCVFLIDNPFSSEDTIKYFLSSLVDAGFSSSRTCLTFVNRCPALQKLQPQHVRNCTPYLHTELQILKPKLIVPMGLLATSALLGTDVKLGDYRGKVVWLGPWAILPTYSPQYVMNEHAGESVGSNFKSDIVSAYTYCYGV